MTTESVTSTSLAALHANPMDTYKHHSTLVNSTPHQKIGNEVRLAGGGGGDGRNEKVKEKKHSEKRGVVGLLCTFHLIRASFASTPFALPLQLNDW